MRKGYFLLLIVLIIISSTNAQTPNDSETQLTKLLKASQSLVITLKASTSQVKLDYLLLDNTENSIETLINISKDREFSPKYSASLQRNEFALRKYQSNKDSKLLKFVSSDYSTKASFAVNNPELAFREILVTAFTITPQGQSVAGFRVFFADTGAVNNMSMFSELTKEKEGTSRLIVSGDYYFSAEQNQVKSIKPDKVFNIGTNYELGTDGIIREKINIDIP